MPEKCDQSLRVETEELRQDVEIESIVEIVVVEVSSWRIARRFRGPGGFPYLLQRQR